MANTAAWAVPAAVLGSIVLVGFVFIWWWFPRAWNQGVRSDHDDVDLVRGEERDAQRRKNREIIERFARAAAAERGDEGSLPGVVGAKGLGGRVGRMR
jgi:hypothetical protein